MTKLCKDCKWAVRDAWLPVSTAKCGSPDIKRKPASRVDGSPGVPEFRYCATQREVEDVFAVKWQACGQSGRLWEQREPSTGWFNPLSYFKRKAAAKARQEALQAVQSAKSRKDTRGQHHAEEAAKRATLEALKVGS